MTEKKPLARLDTQHLVDVDSPIAFTFDGKHYR